jgi:AAA15 family ATPase/GTPase
MPFIEHYIIMLNVIFKSRYDCENIKNLNSFVNMLKNLKEINIETNLTKLEITFEENLTGVFAKMNEKAIRLNDVNIDGLKSVDILNFIHNINTRRTLKGLIEAVKRDIERYEFLMEEIKKFDNNILKVDIFDNEVYVYLNSIKDWVHIKELGEGTQNFIIILSALFANKSRVLFIDEIENGIHFSKFNQLWKLIDEYAEKLNVQVFATTHSFDVIKSFSNISENGVLIELGKGKQLDYITYSPEEVKKELDNFREVRGWMK